MYRVVVATVALMLSVVACTDTDDAAPDTSPSPDGTRSAEALDGGAAAVDPVEVAVADYAGFVEVDPGEVEIVTQEDVTWRDGSLGCPDPDTAYTEERVEGYRIVLRADGEESAYHGKQGLPPFHCEDPDPDGTIDE